MKKNIESIIVPRSIAVLGATNRPGSVVFLAVKNSKGVKKWTVK